MDARSCAEVQIKYNIIITRYRSDAVLDARSMIIFPVRYDRPRDPIPFDARVPTGFRRFRLIHYSASVSTCHNAVRSWILSNREIC